MTSCDNVSAGSISPNSISEAELREILLTYRAQNWKGIQTPEMQAQIAEEMVRPDAESVLQQIRQHWEIPSQACILDIGSGVGGFVAGCRQLGYSAFGVEPDRIGASRGQVTAIQIASRRVSANVFAAGLGEALPFADNSFDLVTLNQVVEHVRDPLTVLREAVRVLRPGGALYVACPNYLRFHEPHYKIFWLPLLPKALGRLYLQIRGRDPVMLRDLRYTTNRRLRGWLSAAGGGCTILDIHILDIHQEQFKRKCAEGQFLSMPARMVQKLVQLPLVGPLVMSAVLFWLRLREGGCEMLLLRGTIPNGQSSQGGLDESKGVPATQSSL